MQKTSQIFHIRYCFVLQRTTAGSVFYLRKNLHVSLKMGKLLITKGLLYFERWRIKKYLGAVCLVKHLPLKVVLIWNKQKKYRQNTVIKQIKWLYLFDEIPTFPPVASLGAPSLTFSTAPPCPTNSQCEPKVISTFTLSIAKLLHISFQKNFLNNMNCLQAWNNQTACNDSCSADQIYFILK